MSDPSHHYEAENPVHARSYTRPSMYNHPRKVLPSEGLRQPQTGCTTKKRGARPSSREENLSTLCVESGGDPWRSIDISVNWCNGVMNIGSVGTLNMDTSTDPSKPWLDMGIKICPHSSAHSNLWEHIKPKSLDGFVIKPHLN